MKNGQFFLILSEKMYIPSELFILPNNKISEYNKKNCKGLTKSLLIKYCI